MRERRSLSQRRSQRDHLGILKRFPLVDYVQHSELLVMRETYPMIRVECGVDHFRRGEGAALESTRLLSPKPVSEPERYLLLDGRGSGLGHDRDTRIIHLPSLANGP